MHLVLLISYTVLISPLLPICQWSKPFYAYVNLANDPSRAHPPSSFD